VPRDKVVWLDLIVGEREQVEEQAFLVVNIARHSAALDRARPGAVLELLAVGLRDVNAKGRSLCHATLSVQFLTICGVAALILGGGVSP